MALVNADTIANTAGTGPSTLLFGSIGQIAGTAPVAGTIGETIRGTNAPGTTAGTTGTTIQITTVSLTAGCWVLFGLGELCSGGTTAGSTSSNSQVGITTTTASLAGTIETYSLAQFAGANTTTGSGARLGAARPMLIANISTTTSYFLNAQANYTSTTPTWEGTLIALRIA